MLFVMGLVLAGLVSFLILFPPPELEVKPESEKTQPLIEFAQPPDRHSDPSCVVIRMRQIMPETDSDGFIIWGTLKSVVVEQEYCGTSEYIPLVPIKDDNTSRNKRDVSF